jgi:hypothetical protein
MSSSVTVAVRVRPFLPRELAEDQGSPLTGKEVVECGVEGAYVDTHLTLQ